MPQSFDARESELNRIPEHTAQSAAAKPAKRSRARRPDGSSQTDGPPRTAPSPSKLTHGKAASLQAQKARTEAAGESHTQTSSGSHRVLHLAVGAVALGLGVLSHTSGRR